MFLYPQQNSFQCHCCPHVNTSYSYTSQPKTSSALPNYSPKIVYNNIICLHMNCRVFFCLWSLIEHQHIHCIYGHLTLTWPRNIMWVPYFVIQTSRWTQFLTTFTKYNNAMLPCTKRFSQNFPSAFVLITWPGASCCRCLHHCECRDKERVMVTTKKKT